MNASPVGAPVTTARGGPQPSDGPGWRLLFLLVQGSRGECARALMLVGTAVLLATLVGAVGITAVVWLGPGLAAGGAGGSLLATAIGVANRRRITARRARPCVSGARHSKRPANAKPHIPAVTGPPTGRGRGHDARWCGDEQVGPPQATVAQGPEDGRTA